MNFREIPSHVLQKVIMIMMMMIMMVMIMVMLMMMMTTMRMIIDVNHDNEGLYVLRLQDAVHQQLH